MARSVRIEELADEVMKGLEEYSRLAADDLKKDVKKAGRAAALLVFVMDMII